MGIFRLLLKLSFLMPVPLIVLVVNFHVDPALLFKSDDYIKELVNQLATKQLVWNLNPNHDERIKQKYMFDHLSKSKPKDVILFGSSRTKAITEDLFHEKSFYNAGVSAGSLEDYIGLYQMLYEKNIHPDEYIVELSAWVLNPKNNVLHGDVHTLSEEYNRGRERLGFSKQENFQFGRRQIKKQFYQKIMELLSPAYFQESIKKIIKDKSNAKNLIEPNKYNFKFNSPPEKEFVLFHDGSWLSAEENRIVTKSEALTFAKYPKGLQNFEELSVKRIKLFEAFIESLIRDGAKVTFFLPPWPPEVYKTIISSKDYKIILEEEKYIQNFSQKHNIKIIGNYDGEKVGVALKDFTDTSHLRRSVMPRVFVQ